MIFSTKIKLGHGKVFIGNYTDKDKKPKGIVLGELSEEHAIGSTASSGDCTENKIYIEIPDEQSLDVFQRAIDSLREKMRSNNEG